jgi:hypothetical protein
MLTSSLAKLAKTFGTSLKGGFNTNLLVEGYNRTLYKSDLLKYNEMDCIVLVQILNKFSELIFKLFKVNIHKYPTASSLAFAI